MIEPTNIVELAKKISDAAQVVSHFANAHDVRLSFDPKDPDPSSMSGPGSEAFHQARAVILEASATMTGLLAGDKTPFVTLCSNFHAASALRVVFQYGLAEAVPAQGSVSYAEVAQKTGLDARTVQRILGVLMGYHIFYQPALGHVAHTRLSLQMITHEGLNALVDFSFRELYTYSHNITDALLKWGPSQEPSEGAFNYSRDTKYNLYEYLDHNKDAQASFSRMMDFLASTELSNMDAIYDGFDWESMGDALVIDVAGSVGHVSVQLARRYPRLRFRVQDYESVCRRGESLLPVDLHDRVRFQPHDMFQDQPKVADRKVVFFVRAILHNWSDKYACRILRAILPALKPGDRIVLNEQIMPEPGTASSLIEQLIRTSDMTMMSAFNGQERTAEQFKDLVREVHPDLQVVQMKSPSALAMGTVEISWK
ncbi:hypothetical protein HFD88_001641 [Aspergillus terreus]|nr:hypothetical protein HFD88_001641 [Aspergillus terreus]